MSAIEWELTSDGTRLEQYVLLGRGPDCAVARVGPDGIVLLINEVETHARKVVEFLRSNGCRQFSDFAALEAARNPLFRPLA